jgi:predicted RNase H-like HicB family nuclease
MTQLMAVANKFRSPKGRILRLEWTHYATARHQFLAAICPEEEGGFSAFALHIPGVVSQGESEQEAQANIGEAFLAILEACRKREKPLPHSDEPVVELNEECKRLWITVDG